MYVKRARRDFLIKTKKQQQCKPKIISENTNSQTNRERDQVFRMVSIHSPMYNTVRNSPIIVILYFYVLMRGELSLSGVQVCILMSSSITYIGYKGLRDDEH